MTALDGMLVRAAAAVFALAAGYGMARFLPARSAMVMAALGGGMLAGALLPTMLDGDGGLSDGTLVAVVAGLVPSFASLLLSRRLTAGAPQPPPTPAET